MLTIDPRQLVQDAVALAFAERERLDAAEWAVRYREVTDGAMAGAWDFARNPYTRGIHLAWSDPLVRQVTTMKCEQCGGTETIFNCLFWGLDTMPGNTLFIYPNIIVAGKVNQDRLKPSMRACARIWEKVGTARSDDKAMELRFKDGSVAFFVGSNSDANIEVFSYRRIIIDELDRCIGGIVGKTRGRKNAWPDGKIFCNGTPTDEGVGIDAEYEKGDRCRWWTPCPACNVYHVREDFRQVEWPRGESNKPFEVNLKDVEREAWYRCPNQECRHSITAHEHRQTSQRGVWLPAGWEPGEQRSARERESETGGDPHPSPLPKGEGAEHSALSTLLPAWCIAQIPAGVRPVWRGEGEPPPPGDHASFHINGEQQTITFNAFGTLAKEFIESKGHPDAEWHNRRGGRPVRVKAKRIQEAELRRLCVPVAGGGYRHGTCPPGTLVLTFACDVQERMAYCEVRGWGECGLDTSLVWAEAVRVDAEAGDFRELERLLSTRYPMFADAEMSLPIGAAAIDSGFFTEKVYRFVDGLRRRGHRLVWPIKGDGGRAMQQPISERDIAATTKVESMRGVPLRLLTFKVNFWKAALMGRIHSEEGLLEAGIGAAERARFQLPEDAPEEYLIQLTAEERVTEYVSGQAVHVFRPRAGYNMRNHWYDACGYNLALAERAGVRNITESMAQRMRAERPVAANRTAPPQQRPGLLGRAGRGILDRGKG